MSPPTSTPALHHTELIFSPLSDTLKTTLAEFKRSNLTITNRLHSISQDSHFVTAVSAAYKDAPLIANERCGSWYIPPHLKRGSVYFKSTDGHAGQWSCSLRRLNLTLFEALETAERRCVVVVDSTRRGKSMSDAMSKTVPIWVCVWNRVLFGEGEAGLELETPGDVVSGSEHAQIEARVQGWVEGIRELGLDLKGLKARLDERPMRVRWQRPGDPLPTKEQMEESKASNLIVLCTASNQTSNETSATSDYVQGAADDPESWSLGLDAAMFWKHKELLLAASEDELPNLIAEIVADTRNEGQVAMPILIKPTSNIFLGTNGAAETKDTIESFDIIVSCTNTPDESIAKNFKDSYCVLNLPKGKNGSRMLRTELTKLEPFLPHLSSEKKVLVTCHTGKDLSVGVALALLCRCVNDDGLPKPQVVEESLNKTLIKQRLSWIMVSMPDASPSRATLQSVNAYLMG